MSNSENSGKAGFRSGYVAIVGRPNVGKSTLLNALLDHKVAIVSSKPQTTRNRIAGIRTDSRSQVVFLDTPGVHRSKRELNKAMLKVVRQAIKDVELVLYMVDSQEKDWTAAERFSLDFVANETPPVILVPNKIDLIRKEKLLPLIQRYHELGSFDAIVPVSAQERDGLETLLEEIVHRLPEGPRYFPEEQLSELTEKDIAGEIVREKIFLLTKEEVPYSTAVVIEAFEELPERNLIRLHATIHVEKQSQKRIIIGKQGQMLGKIGEMARMELERLFGSKVYLELFVRVEKNWTRNPRSMRKLGLLEQS